MTTVGEQAETVPLCVTYDARRNSPVEIRAAWASVRLP